MSIAEKIRVFAFLAAVGGVYVLAAWMLARAALFRIRKKKEEASKAYGWARRVVVALAAVGILCLAYARFIEPFRLTVTKLRVESKRWKGSRPLRIVHLSDLHCDPTPRLEERIPDAVAALKPDLIVFTGDAVNSEEGMGVFRACMTRLAALAPTFAVRGNFEAGSRSTLALYQGTGVHEISGVVRPFSAAGGTLLLAGLPVGEGDRAARLVSGAPPDLPLLFLYHYPDRFPEVAATGRADLYLAGHTHGGQIALPLYGALVTLSEHGKRFEAGLYEENGTTLYVSRGIGMEGDPAPRLRFWSPPELVLIELAAP